MILRKKKSLKYKFLLLLGLLLDEGLDWLEVLSSKQMILLKDRGYPKRTVQDLLRQLTKTGFVEKKIVNNRPVLRFTSQGKIAIARDIPLLDLARKKWDGLFRAVAFDVPEEKRNLRDLLREHLRTLGFGMLQESLWITPYPLTEALAEFVAFHHLTPYVMIMESRHLMAEDAKSFTFRVWRLDQVEERYLDFITTWQEILGDREKIRKTEGEWRGEYLDLLTNDPLLPGELLPNPWIGEKARKLFFQLEGLGK